MGYLCNLFLCPKCKTRFTDETPIFDWDIVNFTEQMIKKAGKLGMPAEQLKHAEKCNETLKQAQIALEEENAAELKIYEDRAEFTSKLIIELTAYKHQILSGNKPADMN